MKTIIPFFRRVSLLLFAIIFSGWGFTIYAQNGWVQMESMDIARGGLQSCLIDSLIYVFGGSDASVDNTLDSADAYNTITNEWSDLANMPEDLSMGTAEVIKNKIYLTGGWRNVGVNNWITTNSTVEYEPEVDSWQEKANSPESMGGMASCVLNDTIYILGGSESSNLTIQKKAWYYAPETDSWGSLPDMIYERPGGTSANTLGNKIYLIGGTYESGWYNPTGKSEVYDQQLKIWTELADMPVHVAGHVSVVHDQKIFVFGGDSSYTNEGVWGTSIGTNFIQEYDPSTDSWRLMKGMPFKRTAMTGEKVGNFVYLIGGYLNSRDLDEPLSEVWRFNFDSLKVEATSGIRTPIVNHISIFPNPVKDFLSIETSNKELQSIEIHSINGQRIYSTKMEGTTQKIDLSSFQKGAYFITVRSKYFVTTRKIIKL